MTTALEMGFGANLIPKYPGTTPNYWCTWAAQNYVYGQGAETLDFTVLEGSLGAQLARNSLDEQRLFGENGWLQLFYPSVRSDLYVVLDHGWDVPYNTEKRYGWFGSLALPEDRFPSFTGTPSARLAQLNKAVQTLGWRGLGLWIAADEIQTTEAGQVPQADYWRERLRWSHIAGIAYWKVDWGAHSNSLEFRRMLSTLARTEAPGLIVEHIKGAGPFNEADDRVPQSFVEQAARLLPFSDVVRTYDVTPALSVPTTLDRVANLLASAPTETNNLGLVNCEDEPIIGATLGCSIGVMRHPLVGLRPQGDPDPFFTAPRNPKLCIDEVIRAIRWQRLAPAFTVEPGMLELDAHILWDEWTYRRGETWSSKHIGQCMRQGAPARVSRGLPLPIVNVDGEPPYVLASLNPNGAAAVATLGRTSSARGFYMPLAEVTVNLGEAKGPVGVFGQYRSLTLQYARNIEHARVWAQDLAADSSMEITADVRLHKNSLYLPGELIHKVGLSAATPCDLSFPGVVVAIKFN